MQQLRIRVREDLEQTAPFKSFLASLPRTFDHVGKDIHHGRNVLKIIDAKGFGIPNTEQVAVKRYRKLFWFQKLDYTFFRKPKCRKAYDNTAELRRRGFEAAAELAIVEVWNHGLFQYAFFVTEMAKGVRLDDLVLKLQEEGRKDEINGVIHQFAAFLKSVHEHGIFYNDMNCGNVICRQDEPDGEWKFCFVDTNRAIMMDPDTPLGLDTVMKDILLMNPKMGTVEQFQEEYLRQRGLYTPEYAAQVRQLQRDRYENRKRPMKQFMKRYKKQYYKWLER